MGLFTKPRPTTVKDAFGKFYEVLEDLKHVAKVNQEARREARNKATELRGQASLMDRKAAKYDAEVEAAKVGMEQVEQLVGKK